MAQHLKTATRTVNKALPFVCLYSSICSWALPLCPEGLQSQPRRMWRPLLACFQKLWTAAVLFSMAALCSAVWMGSKLQKWVGNLEKDWFRKSTAWESCQEESWYCSNGRGSVVRVKRNVSSLLALCCCLCVKVDAAALVEHLPWNEHACMRWRLGAAGCLSPSRGRQLYVELHACSCSVLCQPSSN